MINVPFLYLSKYNGVAANGESENSPSPEVVQGNGKSIYLQLELSFFDCDNGKRSLSNKVSIVTARGS